MENIVVKHYDNSPLLGYPNRLMSHFSTSQSLYDWKFIISMNIITGL